MDIGPLIKDGTITDTEWNTKEERNNKIFFGHWDPKQHIKYQDPYTEPKRTKIKSIN